MHYKLKFTHKSEQPMQQISFYTGAPSTMYSVSIIVPTFKESKNIGTLARRIFKTLEYYPYIQARLVFVEDDSGEDTVKTTHEVQLLIKQSLPVSTLIRPPKDGRGLSSAVLHGLEYTSGDYIVVMDADLQHEPEYIPSILLPILYDLADFSIGSRYIKGSKTANVMPLHRQLISSFATSLAAPLVTCSDPMSGFFALSRKTYEKARFLNPTGYKIGLELMVRCKCSKIVEVPIVFQERKHGESKLTLKQTFLYLVHLTRLYWFVYPMECKLFLFVLCVHVMQFML